VTTTPFSSEELLYQKVALGDISALGALYERNKETVYYRCLGMTKDPAIASDLTQDCFEALWAGRDHLQGVTNPVSYFRKLCRNVVLKFIDTRKNQRLIARKVAEQLPKTVNPYQDITENETHKMLNHEVEQLSPQRREVVRRKLEQLTNRQIAIQMKLSEETIKSHFSNALTDLRKKLTLLGG